MRYCFNTVFKLFKSYNWNQIIIQIIFLFAYNFMIQDFLVYAEINRRVDCAIVLRIELQDHNSIQLRCIPIGHRPDINPSVHSQTSCSPRKSAAPDVSPGGGVGVREASGSVKFPAYCRRVRFRVGWCLTTTTHSPPSVPATRVNSTGWKGNERGRGEGR